MNFIDRLNVNYTFKSKDRVEAFMPVDESCHQPFGFLHGGATIALLETVASEGAWLNCDDGEIPFGVDVHVAHRSSMKSGRLLAETTLAKEEPTSKGYRKQTWSVRAYREDGTTVSEGEIICLIVPDRRP